MKAGAALLVLLAAAPAARAQSPSPALAELDRAARAIAAAGCARPIEEKTTRVGETKDEMRSLDCRSHRIAYYVAAGREQPMALVVLAALSPALPGGLGPGSTPADVQAVLGAPAERRTHVLVYLPRPRDRIAFEVDENGRVRAVSFIWDVD